MLIGFTTPVKRMNLYFDIDGVIWLLDGVYLTLLFYSVPILLQLFLSPGRYCSSLTLADAEPLVHYYFTSGLVQCLVYWLTKISTLEGCTMSKKW